MKKFLNFLFIFFPYILYASYSHEGELGLQLAYGLEKDGWTRANPYLLLSGRHDVSYPDDSETLVFEEISVRFSYESVTNAGRLDLRSLAYNRNGETTSLKIGLQEVSWGETFGLFIVDIVNPRDLSDPLFNELSWSRIPVAAVNYQIFKDPWTYQFILTPLARHNLLPDKGDAFDVLPEALATLPVLKAKRRENDSFLSDMEYGVKIGYLFESGLDLTGFYYKHWNRNIAYEFVSHIGGIALQPASKRIDSFGISFSKAYDEIVLRADTVLHDDIPWTSQTFAWPVPVKLFRAILGLDQVLDKGWSWASQYHLDAWMGPGEGQLHALSGRVAKLDDEGLWEGAIFLLQGINYNDRWLQPKFQYFFKGGYAISLRADFIWGTTKRGNAHDGFLGAFKDKDRVLATLTKRW